jgi:hypothetical protein
MAAVAAVWTARAEELATWAEACLVSNPNAYGYYTAVENRGTEFIRSDNGEIGKVASQYTSKEPVTRQVLIGHFKATKSQHVRGLHTTAPDKTCRWVLVDWDHHGDGNAPAGNERMAETLWAKLRAMDFRPILTKSNNKGGFHLRVIFRTPIPLALAHAYVHTLVTDFATFGLSQAPEAFPKTTNDNEFGLWCRLPGRHHTEDFWSEVWDGERWLQGDDAIDYLLSCEGDDSDLIPEPVTKAEQTHAAKGRMTRDDIARLAQGVGEGDRHDAIGRIGGLLIGKIPDPTDIQVVGYVTELLLAQNQLNKPAPKSEKEVDDYVAHIVKKEIAMRAAARTAEMDGLGGAAPQQLPASPPPKTVVHITTKQLDVNQQVIQALANHPQVFQRGNRLVTIIRDAKNSKRFLRAANTPVISVLAVESIQELMTTVVEFKKTVVNTKGESKTVAAHPPSWSPKQVAARGTWEHIRSLVAVVETPILLNDGRILEQPGYDPHTGIQYEPLIYFPPIPNSVSRAQAVTASDELLELVADFPYAAEHHRAVFLSALLTPFARFAIDGCVPAFLFDGNVAGSGKSLQCDIISVLATGREMTRTSWRENDEELRKTITAVLLEGQRLCLFDNLRDACPFGGPSIDAALTGREWKDRILGVSKMTAALPIDTIFFASGNNITLQGDIDRRILLTRLEAKEENPEERTGFRFPNLIEHVKQHRGRLVVAALTILRGFLEAGSPKQPIPPMGSFEKWSRVVREAVFWVTSWDPRQGRDDLRQANVTRANIGPLLEGWEKLQGNGGRGLTTGEAIKALEEDHAKGTNLQDHARLYEIAMEWSRDNWLPSPRIVGNRLRAIRGRVVNGKMMIPQCLDHSAQVWKVVMV